MAINLDRSLAALEYLAARPEGQPLASIADDLNIPRSACHRMLSDLVRCGWVRQMREHGDYALTTKLAALGLNY
ncbi:MAG: helix-turn-helix domain-containing protein, partial [Hydrogenophaga sp.]